MELFNGKDLTGWSVIPRSYGTVYPGGPQVLDLVQDFPADYAEQAAQHPAAWSVEDGAIVGRQHPAGSGYGGYLISDEPYGDFELTVDVNPDWPADTGVMIRRSADSWKGLQVLVDHRHSGSIGGFFGNGLGSFHAVPFALTAQLDADGHPVGLREDDPGNSAEPFTPAQAALLRYAASVEEFLNTWRWRDWNTLRIRCTGAQPHVTTWINDVKIAELDLATLVAPGYSPGFVNPTGHLAFEVHDNDPVLGQERWGKNAACRWRNITLEPL
ncbi:DUF1080 domain-containing protein [Kribbella sp. NPDC004536]|uniref:3-keto-disaccharide hydrolase n=1 Tax=Kribbella sp. NPDC004536 TaxID=3364106 RepID=UPI0036B56551